MVYWLTFETNAETAIHEEVSKWPARRISLVILVFTRTFEENPVQIAAISTQKSYLSLARVGKYVDGLTVHISLS